MFDFQKLDVYAKAKKFNGSIIKYIEHHSLSKNKKDQLERAAFSIMLNIAEGSGRFTKPDKRNFYVIARGSAFECVAILDFLHDQHQLPEEEFNHFYQNLEEISKMLFALINSLK